MREWLEEESVYWNIYDSARVIITSLAYYYYFYLLYGGKKNKSPYFADVLRGLVRSAAEFPTNLEVTDTAN